MKQLFFLGAILMISTATMAQGNSQGKGKGKDKDKHEAKIENSGDQREENEGNEKNEKNWNKGNSSQSGYAKHQPKKVMAALLRDYPMATNIYWSKYKGDYTATFNNGPWRSTAVYHANGDRRDTRTVLTRAQLPGDGTWDRIFKRDNITPTQIIQIERPSTLEKIYRILSGNNTPYYYDQNGNRVTYVY